ncbi:hypothetical protein BH23CHL2_BH23CHL2_34020 [soil metagenome]
MATRLVLIHSPLVGPVTWTMVADALRRSGWEVRIPTLAQPDSPAGPFWSVHTQSAVGGLAGDPPDAGYVLAGHSGAGLLLPHIGRALDGPVEAYIFVDAGLPHSELSRMAGPFGNVLQDLYARGERFPNWDDATLREILPDADIRSRLLADLRPQPIAFWEEIIPDVDEWPDAPCGYLHFSPAYDDDAARAGSMGFAVHHMAAGHFHMLVDPDAVATAMLDLLDQLRSERVMNT